MQRIFQIKGWQVRKRAIGMRPRIEAVPSVATAPNERWSTDLARVWTGKDGWASLALVIDCHRRELLSWHLSRSGKATTASAAPEHALIRRFGTLGRVNREFLLRSDNGLIFTSRHFTAPVRSYGLKQEFITPPSPSGSDRWRLDRSTREPKRHGRARDPDAQGAMHSPPPLREHPARQPRHRRLDRSAALSDPWRSRPHSTTTAALIRPLPCARLSRHSD
nr:DDE-type integrase/transposase/recombinase [Rhodobacter capsulatus]